MGSSCSREKKTKETDLVSTDGFSYTITDGTDSASFCVPVNVDDYIQNINGETVFMCSKYAEEVGWINYEDGFYFDAKDLWIRFVPDIKESCEQGKCIVSNVKYRFTQPNSDVPYYEFKSVSLSEHNDIMVCFEHEWSADEISDVTYCFNSEEDNYLTDCFPDTYIDYESVVFLIYMLSWPQTDPYSHQMYAPAERRFSDFAIVYDDEYVRKSYGVDIYVLP